MHYRTEKGFSLIEMMIVIAIIAILIATALPSYKKYTQRAHYMEVIQAALPLKLAVAECYEVEGTLQSCYAGVHGIPKRQTNPSTMIASTEVLSGGVIQIIPTETHGIKSHDDYRLTPKSNHYGLSWHPSGGCIQAGLVK